ncbi:type II toxin-antitoxin system CcdA family antitoxin [Falsiroseomonas algicola]|uniref:type II toxin-antitoxin system CcdA family antitoxin n=1 Tax=Falsiroseomonas algicola TaxID=2716930 RepID=UPI001A98C5BA|nr:type II toxin-antitoxin system CcdA family antitoxin [Falsiroseomonas algicola]
MEATPSPITEAIAAAGGVMRLAERLGLSHPSVLRWQRSGKVPAERVAAVEAATGVPRQRLRPDLFPAGAPTTFDEARALGLDPDLIAAQAVEDAVRAEKTRRWQEENRAAMDSWNEWTERNGLPLAKYRMF